MRTGLLLAAALVALAGTPAVAQRKPPAAALNPKVPKETRAALLAQYGDELAGARKEAEAAAAYLQAAELTPDDWTLWDRAGWAYLEAGKDQDALKAFQSARKAAPQGVQTGGGLLVSHYLLAHKKEVGELLKTSVAEGQLPAAQAAIDKGLAAKPSSVEWSYGLGYLFARVLGDSARAVGPLEAVVQADAKHAPAWLLLTEVNRALGRDSQAIAAGAKYVELEPESPDAYRVRAERYAELKRAGQAAAQYEEGIKKHPDAAGLYLSLARLYERYGEEKKAEETYRRLAAAAEERKQADTLGTARIQLANYLARRRNFLEAEKIYREAARKPEASGSTRAAWVSLLALNGAWEEAAKEMEALAAREEKERGPGGDPDALLLARYRAGVTWLAAGNRDAAKRTLTTALAANGESRIGAQAEAEAFRAWLDGKSAPPYAPGDERWATFAWRRQPQEGELEVRGRFSPSAQAWRATLQQVQKTAPDAWPADYALAREYATGGYTEEALRLLRKSSRARSDWWAPHFAVGQYYARERDKENGIPALRTVLRLAPECRQARSYLSLLSSVKEVDDD